MMNYLKKMFGDSKLSWVLFGAVLCKLIGFIPVLIVVGTYTYLTMNPEPELSAA